MPTFIRLTDYKSSDAKEQGFFDPKNKYEAKQDEFKKIPSSPIVYWVSDKIFDSFSKIKKLHDVATPRAGMITGNNELFVKIWHETNFATIGFEYTNRVDAKHSQYKWFPYQKGGTTRKWFGNNEYIVIWEDDGYLLKNTKDKKGKVPAHAFNEDYIFKPNANWSAVSSGMFSVRITKNGSLFDASGSAAFPIEAKNLLYLTSFLNSKIADFLLNAINPTINYQAWNIGNLPLKIQEEKKGVIDSISNKNVIISKEEWDSRETSWDFTKNELLKHKQDGQLENALNAYETYWTNQFNTLHSNEEELNRLFIDIYGLQDELTPDVALEDITILKSEAKITKGKLVFDNKEILKQFISYAVGCMFGRYSLDSDGLVVANMNQKIPSQAENDGVSFEIDDDNIIPIVDESDYFSDDLTDRFTEFVRATFGSEKLQQNIAFIEASLGKKIRAYFMKDFYADHTKRYKKRPIYWLFSSPKGTFQTLIYMHRYTPDTLNHILNDYLRPFRVRLDTMRNEALRVTESEDVSARDKTEADKKIDKIDKTLHDINEYEKILAHYAAQRIEIDLDDGVKVNYCKFKDLLFEFDKKLCE